MKTHSYKIVDSENFWGWEKSSASVGKPSYLFISTTDCGEKDFMGLQKDANKVILFESDWNAFRKPDLVAMTNRVDGILVLGYRGLTELVNAGIDKNKILVAGSPIIQAIAQSQLSTNIVPQILLKVPALEDIDINRTANLIESVVNTFQPYADLFIFSDTNESIKIPPSFKKVNPLVFEESSLIVGISRLVKGFDLILTLEEGIFELVSLVMQKPVFRIGDLSEFSSKIKPDYKWITEIIKVSTDMFFFRGQDVDLDYELRKESLTIEDILKWATTL